MSIKTLFVIGSHIFNLSFEKNNEFTQELMQLIHPPHLLKHYIHQISLKHIMNYVFPQMTKQWK